MSGALAWFEWSVDPDNYDRDSIEAWAQANPALGIRISVEHVRKEHAAMTARPLMFDVERLGFWPRKGVGSRLIPERMWAVLADPPDVDEDGIDILGTGSQITGRLALAVAVPPDQDSAVIAACGMRDDGLRHVEVLEQRRGTAWVPKRLAGLAAVHDPVAIVVDPGSPTGALVPDIEAAGVELVKTSTREYAQACGALLAAIAGLTDDGAPSAPTLRHISQTELDRAVGAAKKRDIGDLWGWARKDAADDVSPLEAVTLAWHGLTVAEDNDPADSVW